MTEEKTCQRPDRDIPEIKCGYSLPCSRHTIVIDLGKKPPTIKRPHNKQISLKQHYRLKRIIESLEEING